MNTEFKINGLQIETARLILRPFRQTDLEVFFEYASVEGVDEMAGWVHHKNKEISQKILDLFILEDKTFAICLKSNHKVIGSLGIEKYGFKPYRKIESETTFGTKEQTILNLILNPNKNFKLVYSHPETLVIEK